MHWLEQALDLVFPIFCADCQKEGEWWCTACRTKMVKQPKVFVPGGAVSTVTAFFNYDERSPLASLIHAFKYQYTVEVATVWKMIIRESEFSFPSTSTIVPVPLFARRERERGFNQAAVIAGLVAERLQLPLCSSNLIRKRATKQQAKLNRQERFANVEDAFCWQGNKRVPEHVILIDDVFTTGATMEACAQALRRQGAKSINGLVLAHG